MVRSTLIAAGAALLCSVGLAQSVADGLYPVTSPVQRGPVINLRTGQPLSPTREAQLRANSMLVYDNTCTWTTAFYTGAANCQVFIDEGQIPGGIGSPNPPLGSTTDNRINFFEVGYCTGLATGAVDIKIGFYNNLGGGCVGGVAPQPPALSTNPATAAFFQLPIATTPGNGCWTVGFDLGNAGFCMLSDGDGVWDNNANLDQFSWSFQVDVPTANTGPLLQGDPNNVIGGCTYNIPCGIDVDGITPCGSGLGTEDIWWVNTDNDPVGPGGTNTGVQCSTLGTNCYWFGGHPGNPFASFYLKLGSAGSCAGCTGSPVNYCTAGTTSNGCNATMALTSGIPSPRNLAPAIVTASNVEGNKSGLIFYGTTRVAFPWSASSTSFLCVKSPTIRTLIQSSGGTNGACDGSLSTDINAALATPASQAAIPTFAGTIIDIQAWFRDPPAPKTTKDRKSVV